MKNSIVNIKKNKSFPSFLGRLWMGLFFIISTTLFSQTKISGKVYDAETREALPFVSIACKGTKVGTTSDFDGNFILSTSENSDSLVATYVGYLRTTVRIKKGISQTINIELRKNTIALNEVVIKAGENPAHRILRKVITNKDKNDREKLEAYQYEVYNKVEFDLNNLSEKFRNKKALKPFRFVFDYIDSSSTYEKPYLPWFVSESLSDYYYNKTPRHKKEIIKASKVSGIKDESVSQFMGEMYQQVNIYDNNVLVFGKNFASPISDNGLFYYRYYLLDSTNIGNHRCYHIQFKPKRKQELLFSGNMWISDTTFAVKRLEMSIPDDANINFVASLNVVQEYEQVDSTWMLNKDKLVIDFKLRDRDDKMGMYGRKTTSYKDYVINKPKEGQFYSGLDNLIVEKGADEKTEDFWKTVRHDSLTENEAGVYKMVDTIQSMPIYKSIVNLATIFLTGYKVWGLVEIGPYFNMYSFNKVEKNRFRLGGRTSDKFSKWYELNGYAAYGTGDNEFKYSAGFRTFITKNPRQILSFNYKNDYEILGQSSNAFTQDNILASFLRRNPLSNLTRVEQYKTSYEFEWFEGFNNKLFLTNRVMTPVADFRYVYQNSDSTIGYLNNIKTSEISLLSRFAWDEKYIEGTFSRISTGTKWPILSVQLTTGLKGVIESNYEYQKLVVNINDRFRLQPIGYTDYVIEGGKIFGKVPYPLLELHGGNETYTYDPFAFNMMNYYEFASDEYVTVQAFHHFEGFFLNKIPLLRKLKWREVVTAKALIGRVNNKNRELLIFPTTLSALDKGPYYEAGVGIENIFKIFRVDALWRLSYLDRPNIAKFGIRGSIQLIF